MYATTPHERSRSPLSPQQSASSDRYPGDGHYQPWAKSSSTSALPSAHPGHVASHQSRIAALLNDDDNDADYPHGSPPTKRVAKDSDREMSHSASHSPAVLHPSEPKRSLGQSERTTNSQVPRSITTNHIATSGSTVSATTGGSTSSGGGGGSVGSRTQFHAPLEPEVVQRLDELFFKFLQRICSDLDARDSKGDHIHQPLMAKKMQRLEASADFRPFKFRIQAFTNAFHESLIQHGLSEDILPLRKVKVYLWKHKYISRFNEDGKKQKSKGNHVWNIEARRIAPPPAPGSSSSSSSSLSSHGKGSSASTAVANSSYYSSSTMVNSRFKSEHEAGSTITTSTGGTVSLTRPPSPPIQWEFREYTSRIAGQIIKFARVGVRYTYTPKIWDAQMSCPEAEYSSPWLPPWLKWENKELVGTPSAEDKSCTITVKAVYDREGTKCELETSFPITILHQDETEDGSEKDEEEAEQLKKAASGGRGRPPLLPKPTTAAKSTQQLPNDATSEAEREPAEDDMEIDSTRENQSQQQEENKRYLRSNRSSQQRRPRRHDDDDGADGEIDEDEREKGGEDEGEEGEDEEEDDEDDGDAMNVEYEDRSGDGDYEDDDDVLNGPDSEGIEDEDEEMAEDEHGEPFSGGRQHRGQPSSPSHRRRSSAGGASSSSSNGRRRSSSSTSGRGRRSSMSGIRGVGATAGKVNRASRRETNGPVSRTASTKEAKRPRQ
ncbi:hypothetical protein BGW41_003738 [Actinomortierella wolfii]|nr:hypothetical protein BGW41_003738 [Actinomortierella wolfii]